MRGADQTGHSSRDEPTQHKKNDECRSGSYAKRYEVKRHGSWRHRKVGHGGTSFMRSACSLTTATHCARSTRASEVIPSKFHCKFARFGSQAGHELNFGSTPAGRTM